MKTDKPQEMTKMLGVTGLVLTFLATACSLYFYSEALRSGLRAIPQPGGLHGRLSGGAETYILTYLFHAWLEMWCRALFIPISDSDIWVVQQTPTITIVVVASVWWLLYLSVFQILKRLPPAALKHKELWATALGIGTVSLMPIPSILFMVRMFQNQTQNERE
jgi:hypothetical protein